MVPGAAGSLVPSDTAGRSTLLTRPPSKHDGTMTTTGTLLAHEAERAVALSEGAPRAVRVNVVRGVATVRGVADDDASRAAAIDAVASTPGVTHVLDAIRLRRRSAGS